MRVEQAPGRRLLRVLIALGALTLVHPQAQAQSVDCGQLARQIDAAARGGAGPDAGKFAAAARRQRAEIDRTAAYMQSIGCNQRQFLFFGSPPPPQCGGLSARMRQMMGNLSQLEAQAAPRVSAQEAALRQSYDYYCSGGGRRGGFDPLFDGAGGLREIPIDPDAPIIDEDNGGRASGGSAGVCVRTCDGGFFPLPVSTGRGNLEEVEQLCQALCPNTEAKLFTMRPGAGIGHSISRDGESYASQSYAFRYQKSYDKSCTCKPPDKGWAEALAEAEKLLGRQSRSDIIVTPQKAEELSRARPAAQTPQKGAPGGKALAPSAPLAEAPAAAVAPAAPLAAPADTEDMVDVVGPDGVRRKVRRVGPRT